MVGGTLISGLWRRHFGSLGKRTSLCRYVTFTSCGVWEDQEGSCLRIHGYVFCGEASRGYCVWYLCWVMSSCTGGLVRGLG